MHACERVCVCVQTTDLHGAGLHRWPMPGCQLFEGDARSALCCYPILHEFLCLFMN